MNEGEPKILRKAFYEVERTLPFVLDLVRTDGISILIEDGTGHPMAALISMDNYERLPKNPSLNRNDYGFTERQLEVMRLMASGRSSTKELADILSVSRHTIKYHTGLIMRNLGVQSRTDAVAKMMGEGLLLPQSNGTH